VQPTLAGEFFPDPRERSDRNGFRDVNLPRTVLTQFGILVRHRDIVDVGNTHVLAIPVLEILGQPRA
jgi:hypothetical protein